MKTHYQYIHFAQVNPIVKRSTQIWNCCNNRSGDVLGVIEWYGTWRQYCFQPMPGTIFNSGCLTDIQDFIRQLMEARNRMVKAASVEVIG